MMDNEKDITLIGKEFHKNRIYSTIENLKRFGGVSAYYSDNKSDAITLILKLMDDCLRYNKEHYVNSSRIIGFGDSQTLHEIDLLESVYVYAEQKKCTIINPFERLDDGRYIEFAGLKNGWIDDNKPYEEAYLRVMEKMRHALLSDIFITSANAITTSGEIVSTDGVGNRIAGVIFGPYKVIIVVGRNKIVDSEDEAISRIKNFTTPMNHLRHALKHSRRNEDGTYLEKDSLYQLSKLPCVIKGHCMNCNAKNCSRRVTMVMRSATGGSMRDRIHVVFINEDLGI